MRRLVSLIAVGGGDPGTSAALKTSEMHIALVSCTRRPPSSDAMLPLGDAAFSPSVVTSCDAPRSQSTIPGAARMWNVRGVLHEPPSKQLKKSDG
ncbi:hypothetical protein SKAU_G00047900 [Synaphobranchus kaupii]|uniref:Uncharacterized protein n=1 Tax=Synaphobranchus kaupii TaxID=118154 RepID=A0A9Q1G3R9_SYNKA|nr:hypothetical protein SKAU_G00047900 [Synaphobranchus kaupii]